MVLTARREQGKRNGRKGTGEQGEQGISDRASNSKANRGREGYGCMKFEPFTAPKLFYRVLIVDITDLSKKGTNVALLVSAYPHGYSQLYKQTYKHMNMNSET